MPDHSTEIAQLQAIVNRGVESSSVDGLSQKIDLSFAEKRLRQLLAEHDGDSETTAPIRGRRTLKYKIS